MADEILKQNLDRAFDPGPDFPGPWLLSRTMAALGAERTSARIRWSLASPSLFMPLVATLLALVVIATLVLAGRAIHPQQPLPVQRAPSPQAPGASCSGYARLRGDLNQGNPPDPVKMVNASTAWAEGGLLTTDGGKHWRDVSPHALRSDEPVGNDRGLLPPGFTDFFLDQDHAWEVRGYSQATACDDRYDHLTVFATSDGGRAWTESAPVILKVPSGYGANEHLFFLDASTGWLMVLQGRRDFGVVPTEALVYATADGGTHWKLISDLTPASLGLAEAGGCAFWSKQVVFASKSDGWMTIRCGSGLPKLIVTHDGGVSWAMQAFPELPGCPCGAAAPYFFDAESGVVARTDMASNPLGLLSTQDGGKSWQLLPPLPDAAGNSPVLYFGPNRNIWDVVTITPPKGSGATNQLVSLYRSSDGGKSWMLVRAGLQVGSAIASGPPEVFAFVFGDQKHGLMAAIVQHGTPEGAYELLATSDGGHTWSVLTPEVESSP